MHGCGENFQVLLLGISFHYNFYSIDQRTTLRILSASEFMHSGPREITTEWVHGPIGPIVRCRWIRILFLIWSPSWGILVSVVSVSGQTLHLIVWVFPLSPLSGYSGTCVSIWRTCPFGKQGPVGGTSQGNFFLYICDDISGSFLKNTWSLL